jgi:hypothetical protein
MNDDWLTHQKKEQELLNMSMKESFRQRDERKMKDKMRIAYDDWLQRYKGKTVFDLTCQENTIFLRQYKSWRVGNIEKV